MYLWLENIVGIYLYTHTHAYTIYIHTYIICIYVYIFFIIIYNDKIFQGLGLPHIPLWNLDWEYFFSKFRKRYILILLSSRVIILYIWLNVTREEEWEFSGQCLTVPLRKYLILISVGKFDHCQLFTSHHAGDTLKKKRHIVFSDLYNLW